MTTLRLHDKEYDGSCDDICWQKTAIVERKGDWMQTFTGRQFWPMDPRPEDVCIEDIAHALSMICRYGGHTKKFYSVAEHSCRLAGYAERVRPNTPLLWLATLLHDASEAYLVDVPRPVKPFLVGYREAERRVGVAVARALAVPHADEYPHIKHWDTRILIDETKALMPSQSADWYQHLGKLLGVNIEGWEPGMAENAFLRLYEACWVARRAEAGPR